ncbi:MAG: ABC transporter permease, partial [Bacteroidia bacterium]|nr:ABC transporter permease [Bacteroidia bacterium]
LVLAFWALLLAIPGGVLLGYYMALYHERRWMRIVRGFTLILYVIPVFVLASFMLLYLATPEGIALFAPYGEAEWDPTSGFMQNLWQSFLHLALPVCALALGLTLFFGAQVRDWLLARFGKEYVRAALSRGIPFRQVLRRHIFPDIRVPFISMIGQAIPEIASGSVIIEYIFARRGLGQLILEASMHRDLYLLLALLWLTGLFTFTGNTLADLITARTDKRIVLK